MGQLSSRRGACDNGLFPPLRSCLFMSASDYKKYMCVVCGFIYDEALGLPEEGLALGTRWADIPETWTCPDCGVTKADFEMVETG